MVSGTTKLLFAATSLLSAFLLFQVQLIVSKHILPWFGGSAAVWTTSMLVFQILLLCGYVYSHLISARLSVAAQAKLHLALLAAVLLLVLALMFLWPSAITPGASWKPAESGNPVGDVALILLVSAGLPFFVLSTTAPLLQRWFARLGVGARTYKLYSISNLGSLLGLLSFPFLLEPALRMKTQSLIWSLLFFVFVAGCSLCALQVLRAREESNSVAETEEIGAGVQTSPLVYTLWFLLPACASALLLATTNLLCQEVTSVPLLWVLPLSIYLLSFILCFDHPRWYQRSAFHPLFIIAVFVVCAALIYERPIVQLATLPILLFIACMICHGELVRLRPGVERLTAFYLAISAGGAVGGVFVAIVAPHVFKFFTEFQLTLGAALVLTVVCLYRDPGSWIYKRGFWLPAGIGVGAICFAYAVGRGWPEIAKLLEESRFYPIAVLISFLATLGAFTFRSADRTASRGFRFVQVLVLVVGGAAIFALGRSTQPLPGLYLSARNFYGAIRVFNIPRGKMLMHGRTVHGGQFEPPVDKEPTTYYGRQSGIGTVMQNHPKRSVGDGSLRVGIIGLGAGTLAAYGRHGDYFRYYEINPQVIALSSGPSPVFTYIQDSAAHVDTVLGDARRLLEQETARGDNQKFDVLVVDAFSGDAIPVHLLTREAFETYWQHVDPTNGIIAIHVSSRHVDLLPVALGAAADFQADSVVHYEEGEGPLLSNCWVLLARTPGLLSRTGLEQRFPPDTKPIHPRLWTDDYSDVFRLIRY
ncbi:MAG: hypothetical protein LAO30_14520 [Acidobacteriia bacterium]|nr:hypothetical protein [Terriglobia bacterium]